jgi:NADH-quinone oxidoreductase subunit N
VQLHEIATEFLRDTQASLWPVFAPELIICITIMVLLIVRLFRGGDRIPVFLLTLAGALCALYFAAAGGHLPQLYIADPESIPPPVGGVFTGMLVYDGFTVFMRALLLVFVVLFAIFTRLTGIPDRNDAVDFYCLVLGATLGMCLMASANHLLMVFLAVEVASVPSYALAGQLKHRRQSSEAALKYAVYGAGAAGVMLYGISLVAGVLNTAHLPTLAQQLVDRLPGMSAEQTMVLALGGVMIMVGLAFKLSAVPFHFWCPDVFEGATAEVDAFLSVASKAAALALLVRVAIGFGVPPAGADPSVSPTSEVAQLSTPYDPGQTRLVAETEDSATTAQSADSDTGAMGTDPLVPVRKYICLLVGVVAVVTCTFGNLAAFGQTNIKRLMAYSTIAHAGYMMLAIPAALAVAGRDPVAAQAAIAALALYIAIYLLMNLGAFAVIAFYRNSLNSEEIRDYAGLVRRSPVVVIMFTIILFSLVGLPPLAGFLGKFAIFAALTQSWRITGNLFLLVLLIAGGVNTAISLFYYLRVVKVMTIDSEMDSTAPTTSFSLVSLWAGTFLALLTVPILTLLLYINTLNEWTLAAARQLF